MTVPADVDTRLQRVISGALRGAIRTHGPITGDQIGSAAKRVLGAALRHAPDTKPGEALPVLLVGRHCHCARCGHRWLVTPKELGEVPERPARCAACTAHYWWEPTGTRPRGRPRNPDAD